MKASLRRTLQLPTVDFVQRLAAAPRLTSVFNPWRDDALAENLAHYLNSLLSYKHFRPILIIGEALGYKGGRNTGIPFSSSLLFQDVQHPFLQLLGPQLTVRSADSEATATIVWEYLKQKSITPLFWNAFPFHPHQKYKPRSNRKPNSAELRRGLDYLLHFADLFQPAQIAGLGRVGYASAQQVFPEHDIRYIRHPSYGGKREFVQGMDELLR